MQILNRDADSSKLGKRKRRKRIHDIAQKSRDMGQRGEKGRETGRHKVRKWDGITGWEGKETMEGEVGMEGAVGQEAGKKKRARTSEWTWDGLIIWSNLLLCQRVWRRRCQFLSCLLDSHHLWSHFEQVSSVLRNSQYAFVFQPWNINFEVQIYFLKEVRRFVHLRKNRAFWGSQCWQLLYKLWSKNPFWHSRAVRMSHIYSLRELVNHIL